MRYILFVLFCALATQGEAAQSENDLLDQLRADYAALLEARLGFEEMENNCDTSRDEQADFAVWIQQLSEEFAETCRTVLLHSTRSIPADIPCGEFTATFVKPAGIDTQHESTDAEKTAAMVSGFNDSLGEFDEKLLREQDRVKARKPLSTSANSAGGGMTGGPDGESEGESERASADDSPTEGAREGQQSGQQGSDQTATGARGGSSRAKQSTAPADIPDGSDDDVIARQLREAAEKEADPELKKKLWEEYRRYKKG